MGYVKCISLNNNCNNSCRMVAPRLKNLEGLLSIEADSVSRIVFHTFESKYASLE